MNAAVKWGVILGVVVGVWGIVLLAMGMQENLMLYGLLSVPVFILVTIVCVVLALRGSKSENSYGSQMKSALILGLVAAVVIFILSFINTSVLHPEALGDLTAAQTEMTVGMLENAGMSQAEIDEAVANIEEPSPFGAALQGSIWTVVTTMIVAAIAGIWLRRKS